MAQICLVCDDRITLAPARVVLVDVVEHLQDVIERIVIHSSAAAVVTWLILDTLQCPENWRSICQMQDRRLSWSWMRLVVQRSGSLLKVERVVSHYQRPAISTH